jgi:uncharacterized protein YydD (DUF2326 family)
MIRRIYSSLASFKEVEFTHGNGLNLLMVDKSPGATDLQTRNRAGKSSLIEIIHFLLGSNCDRDSIFRSKSLVEFSFGMEFDLGDTSVTVERSGSEPNQIHIRTDNYNGWPILPKGKEDQIISNTNWRSVLGTIIFSLKAEDDPNLRMKYAPTFRSLFSYFARREADGAFSSPMTQSSKQQLYDQQVALSYLIGLDWTIGQQWQMIRDREAALKELKKIAGDGFFGESFGTVASLRTELSVAESKINRMAKEIAELKVLPQYHELESEASNLNQKIAKLSDENIIDHGLISSMKESLEQEMPPAIDDLNRIYNEAGLVFPDRTIRHFEDLRKFHESVLENRKSYLSSEIEKANRRVNEREQLKQVFSAKWSEIMSILRSHGALDQYSRMQSMLSKLEAETEVLRQRFLAAEQLESKKTELDIERSNLLVRLRQDYQERKSILSDAIISFQEISSSLYEGAAAGKLTISDSKNGPQFEVIIQGQKSKGIKNMQVFCFDMMLIKICTERGLSPGFLIHDSHIFDGVDERQIAKALEIGANLSKKLDFQYIVTMNSDDIPKELPDGFDLRDYILPVRLTDATEDGGLFGKRF